ncbi:MAG: DUF433 domain-containing protein [Chloroflexi bacterium]|nr:DUF433 domain-containing protein [Chloroflexota bacterium]
MRAENMNTVQKSLRVPVEVSQAIEEMAETSRRDFSSVANELLTEAVKMRRCPGVTFGDGPAGRRARIAGTGLEVWEVVAAYKAMGQDWRRLQALYAWLTESQLRAALGYYTAYPEEVERHIARNEGWTSESLAQKHPSLSANRQ